ncbi:unnamed protein product [Hymenolepis diminuta]|uniref:Uncharacterized protein n=1 Tax=Hymenolepis diminuta TaxID=6216 RepID=A0A564YTX3_HYMDI|nr:unnamed protein product [Hymenolepis diminuta]
MRSKSKHSLKPSWNKPNEIHSQRMPEKCKEPNSPRSRTMATNGSGYTSISGTRSTPHPSSGGKSPAEVLMGRKLRTVHEAMPRKKTLPDRWKGSQKNGSAVNTPVYARDY